MEIKSMYTCKRQKWRLKQIWIFNQILKLLDNHDHRTYALLTGHPASVIKSSKSMVGRYRRRDRRVAAEFPPTACLRWSWHLELQQDMTGSMMMMMMMIMMMIHQYQQCHHFVLAELPMFSAVHLRPKGAR